MFCRSPSWGAWIEMSMPSSCVASLTVAPPRGERGLKSRYTSVCAVAKGRSPSWGAWIEIWPFFFYRTSPPRRSPSWGAWIEIWQVGRKALCAQNVAPPRGERGLKCKLHQRAVLRRGMSLPLVGSVD